MQKQQKKQWCKNCIINVTNPITNYHWKSTNDDDMIDVAGTNYIHSSSDDDSEIDDDVDDVYLLQLACNIFLMRDLISN